MQTLEQQRAAFAWKKVQGCDDRYTGLAKGAPALIMNSGLMQTLAFYQSKGKDHHKALLGHLCAWLKDCDLVEGSDYRQAMKSLHQARSADYRRATDEALALLRWLRQLAPTVGR